MQNTTLRTRLEQIEKWPDHAERSLTHVAASQVAHPRLVVSVKANIDVKGWVTHASSRALTNESPASEDAELVQVLRALEAIPLMQTNMTEFAYGALGLNAEFGTPCTPLYPGEERAAGGSSSGAAVSVALGFADLALCSDTSGSARIPAAFCGVAGMIPSHGRWPMGGFFPLAPSFDVPGLMMRSVRELAPIFRKVDQSVTGFTPRCMAKRDLSRLRLCIPTNVLNNRPPDIEMARAFDDTVSHLQARGLTVQRSEVAALEGLGALVADAGMISAEAYGVHRSLLESSSELYDPLVRSRIELGATVPAWRYAQALEQLRARRSGYLSQTERFDALLLPTTPMLPPRVEDVTPMEQYLEVNRRAFAYTELANRLGAPSVSIPLTMGRTPGVGMMLVGKPNEDIDLLNVAITLESALGLPATGGDKD